MGHPPVEQPALPRGLPLEFPDSVRPPTRPVSVLRPRTDAIVPADQLLTDRWSSAVRSTAGLPFVATESWRAAADLVAAATAAGRAIGEHVHLANAYSAALADTQPAVDAVFRNDRGWLLPDGRPLTWISALRRDRPRLRQVRGPRLLLDVADIGRESRLRHYLLGSTPTVLHALRSRLEADFPSIEIVGASSPPFRAMTSRETANQDNVIRASGAQIVWVGLGTPKQDFETRRLATALPVVVVAVGAAFDYGAGTLRAAPDWVSTAGLEWLWRLGAEPRRLWRRYTIGNLQFVRAVIRAEASARRSGRAVPRRADLPTGDVLLRPAPPLRSASKTVDRSVERDPATERRSGT